jgi:hypothetical protein
VSKTSHVFILTALLTLIPWTLPATAQQQSEGDSSPALIASGPEPQITILYIGHLGGRLEPCR